MAGESREALHDRINRKIYGHVLGDSSACSIFKVPNHLRQINERAYEPQVISIGPYHHGKEHLKAMEVQKMKSLKLFLDRTGESSVERYVTALEEMEGEVRKFYSEPLDHIGGKELVEMMLFDGCFIIELIFHGNMELLLNSYLRNTARDLLLVENQLPFPVLSKLYSLSTLQLNDADRITDAIISFFNRVMPAPLFRDRSCGWSLDYVKHLLDVIHSLSSSFWGPLQVRLRRSAARLFIDSPAQGVPRESSTRRWQFIRSATELNEAGIKFQKSKLGRLFWIGFKEGVMSIPTLKIEDDTESILRNLVAFEQCYKRNFSCFTDYITFMDCLINTGQDVKLLCRCGVLDNWLSDHEIVAMFNRLRDSVLISENKFFYSEIFIRVNEHCNRKWNLWKANLWRNYFSTPWALISSVAAAILLLFALL